MKTTLSVSIADKIPILDETSKHEQKRPFLLKVWGPYACFTRPEFKTNRVSYDVMTPAAARGIVTAIYWHPGVEYVIDRIWIAKPIQYVNITKNEYKKPGSIAKAKKQFEQVIHTPSEAYYETRQSLESLPRSNAILKDVCYYIEFHMELNASMDWQTDEVQTEVDFFGKHQSILRKRMKRGGCYHRPYFGMREYPAYFEPADTPPEPIPEFRGTRSFGYMLGDMDYTEMNQPGQKKPVSPKPIFFLSEVIDGCMTIPREVRKW